MKRKTITQTKIIHEENAADFEVRLNAVLRTVSEPDIKYVDGTLFCAYVTYQTEEKTIETAEDEYIEKTGGCAHCGDCPYLVRNEDKRIKYHSCKYSEFARKTDSCACELYYQRFFNGTL